MEVSTAVQGQPGKKWEGCVVGWVKVKGLKCTYIKVHFYRIENLMIWNKRSFKNSFNL